LFLIVEEDLAVMAREAKRVNELSGVAVATGE